MFHTCFLIVRNPVSLEARCQSAAVGDADEPQGKALGERDSGKALRLGSSGLTSCSGSGLSAFLEDLSVSSINIVTNAGSINQLSTATTQCVCGNTSRTWWGLHSHRGETYMLTSARILFTSRWKRTRSNMSYFTYKHNKPVYTLTL